jgi:hypothetical protein
MNDPLCDYFIILRRGFDPSITKWEGRTGRTGFGLSGFDFG